MEARTEFNEAIINAAKELKFISGHDNNKKFKVELEKNPEKLNRIRNKEVALLDRFPQYIDDDFNYNANKIIGTHFIAAGGPKSESQLSEFIANTAFNKKCPVSDVVALGFIFNKENADFYDYCTTPGEIKLEKYDITVKKIKGGYSEADPSLILNSELQIKDKESKSVKILNVTLIPLADNHSLHLSEDKNDSLKELLWQCAEKSKDTNILVHCASGVGRTGHLILMLEIVKHYNELFVSNNPVTIAKKILELLTQMRETRPALVYKEEQFDEAIRNAELIVQYALKKHYIQPLVPDKFERVTPTLFSPSRKTTILLPEPEPKRRPISILNKFEFNLTLLNSLIEGQEYNYADNVLVSLGIIKNELLRYLKNSNIEVNPVIYQEQEEQLIVDIARYAHFTHGSDKDVDILNVVANLADLSVIFQDSKYTFCSTLEDLLFANRLVKKIEMLEEEIKIKIKTNQDEVLIKAVFADVKLQAAQHKEMPPFVFPYVDNCAPRVSPGFFSKDYKPQPDPYYLAPLNKHCVIRQG